MNITNPYAQAGWSSSGNSNGSAPPPSIFGALPWFSEDSDPSSSISLHLFNPDILNSTLMGPQSRPYFRVINNAPSRDFTLIQNRDGGSVAIIEWRESGAVVEVRDIIRKQLVSTWLPLSGDQKYRFMNARDRTMVWVPKNELVELYTYGTTTPELYARIGSQREGKITLEISSTAMQIGLLECCVVAAILLRSGRIID
ncbi:hypothetical protein BT96DRAFT_827877 [Gymnopus androsaceus JB14]|uniref:DUF6593 domain-containing protein n=1 Tax=Gymnopus androsaceus JB14 TaxID=1447944 RepID=A0A6A4H9D0_9AGAR|nr:hypothetical protein BT96DRAFT_827877 [Gymnopus androsaceus JB14]